MWTNCSKLMNEHRQHSWLQNQCEIWLHHSEYFGATRNESFVPKASRELRQSTWKYVKYSSNRLGWKRKFAHGLLRLSLAPFIRLQRRNIHKSILDWFLLFVLFMRFATEFPNNLTWFVAHDCLTAESREQSVSLMGNQTIGFVDLLSGKKLFVFF